MINDYPVVYLNQSALSFRTKVSVERNLVFPLEEYKMFHFAEPRST